MATNVTTDPRKIAEKWNSTRLAIKRLTEEMETYEAQMRQYVEDTGDTDLGIVKAYTRTSPAKLEVRGGSTLAKVELAICDKIDPDFVTKKLNVPYIVDQWASNGDLRTVLTGFGVTPVEGESKVYFKHV